MMSKIKKYLPEIIVILVIISLMFANFYSYSKYKNQKEQREQKEYVVDSLLLKIKNDSTAVELLEQANENCINSTTARMDYYDNRIKNLNREIDKSKKLIYDIQAKKEIIDQRIKDVDTIKMSPTDLLNFINKKY